MVVKPQEKITPVSQQPLTTDSSPGRVEPHLPFSHLWWNVDGAPSCADNHSHCESKSVVATSRPGNSVPQHPSPSFVFHSLLLPPLPRALAVVRLVPHLEGHLFMDESNQYCKLNYRFKVIFWRQSHLVWATLALNSWSVCFGFPSSGIVTLQSSCTLWSLPYFKEGDIDSRGTCKPWYFGWNVRNEISTTIRVWQCSLLSPTERRLNLS